MKRLFLFDFDGVLFDSNKIKTRAFRAVLEHFPTATVETFIEWHEANGGIGRREKFEHFYALLDDPREDKGILVNTLIKSFSVALQNMLYKSQPIFGAKEFVSFLHRSGFELGICSGGDKDEIVALLKKHGMEGFFSFIKGNELSKQKHCSEISEIYQEVIFFGDAKYDYEVAVEFNFEFIFVYGASDWRAGVSRLQSSCRLVKDFSEIDLSVPVSFSTMAAYPDVQV